MTRINAACASVLSENIAVECVEFFRSITVEAVCNTGDILNATDLDKNLKQLKKKTLK